MLPERDRRHGNHEARGRRRQQPLGVVGDRPREVDEAMTDERRLADQQRARGRCDVPTSERRPRPSANGDTDQPVRDALCPRIAAPGGTRLEGRSRDVPLQQMNVAAARVGQMRELMDQQALARAGQACEEHAARVTRETLQRVQQGRALAEKDAFG